MAPRRSTASCDPRTAWPVDTYSGSKSVRDDVKRVGKEIVFYGRCPAHCPERTERRSYGCG